MTIFEQLKRSWVVAKKNLAIYYLKGPVVVFGLLLPAFLFISFSLKRQISVESLIPGLLGMALFFTVSSITPGIMPWETRMKTLERLVSSPISVWAIVLGDILASFLYGLIISTAVFLLSTIFLGKLIISLPLVLGTILAAFCFSSLGALISSLPTDTPSNVMMLATLVKFPLVFISGVFVPIAEMGDLRVISYLSPLSYYTDLLRQLVQGESHFSLSTDLLALLGFCIILFIAAIKFHEKSMTKWF